MTARFTFIRNRPPTITGIGVWSWTDGVWVPAGGTVNRGDLIRIIIWLTHPVAPVNISYRLAPAGGWTTIVASYFDVWNYFYYNWDTTGVALGWYDVKADSEGATGSTTNIFEIIV